MSKQIIWQKGQLLLVPTTTTKTGTSPLQSFNRKTEAQKDSISSSHHVMYTQFDMCMHQMWFI